MKNYLALDSGGTKVVAVLYDEDFYPVATCRVGSFRANTTSAQLVRQNMEQLVHDLGLTAGTVIDRVSGIFYPEFIDFLKEKFMVLETHYIDEPIAGLCAAQIFGDGLLTLSGTGSHCAAFYNNHLYIGGAYGANVSDIGSGYWIGREAINAAIADFEGYGPNTVLTDLIAKHFGGSRESFRHAIFSIYENTKCSPSSMIASCTPLVSKAAHLDDDIAKSILKSGGGHLALQTTALIRKYTIPSDLPLTFSGSVWHSHPIFLNTFIEGIRTQCQSRTVRVPTFEPIIGVIIRHYYSINGNFTDKDCNYFKELYPQHIYEL